MINGTINGATPDPHKHTSPFPKVGGKKSYGVVLINGRLLELFASTISFVQSRWSRSRELIKTLTRANEHAYES